MPDQPAASRYIIQLDRPGEKLEMSTVVKLFDGLAVKLDADYGPVLVNPKLGRYVVRGTATSDARSRAEAVLGAKFFGDVPIRPLSG